MLFRLLFVAYIVFSACAGSCYTPDGTIATDQPCPGSKTCCSSTGVCLSNGFCLQDMVLSRGSCAEKNWQGCPSQCKQVNPSGGAQLASCFPGKWSCDPSTCTTANFSLSEGNVVLRNQSPTSTTSCSASVGTETVFVTPPALASIGAASQSKACTTKAKRSVDMAIVGISVGMPLSILAIVAWVMVVKEKGLRKRISKDKEEMEGKLLSAQRGRFAKAWPRYEMRSDPKSPAIVQWIEKSVGPPSRRGSPTEERRNRNERQTHEMRSEPKYPTAAEWYEKSASPVSRGRSRVVETKSTNGRSPKEDSRPYF